MEFYRRIAQFFFFFGIMVLFLYWAASQSPDAPAGQLTPFMICGIILISFSLFLFWRFRSPPVDAERFRTFRKLLRTEPNKKEHIKKSE